ncbi:MAG: hypothetical protein PHI28_00435 [Mangrovibacterium sp.]|nr:hypothetical protein [Mangrovibacterium sp.]
MNTLVLILIDEVYVFDHVEATVLKRNKSGVTLRIANPTSYNAQVSILAETSRQAREPLSCTAFVHWPKIEVKPGESKIVTIQRGVLPVNGRPPFSTEVLLQEKDLLHDN